MDCTLLVIAKEPVPGRVKTRLTPPCTPDEAARLARAALEDTLAAVAEARRPARRLVVLDGHPGDWVPAGFDVVAQRAGDLAERLAGAFADAGGPALLVGMDTPQLTAGLLDTAIDALATPGVDAAFGPAPDGGFWAIGLRTPDPAVFRDVPMSRRDTGLVQAARLAALGLRTATLPPLHDVDTIADAQLVAAHAPHSRFAAVLAEVAGDADGTPATGAALPVAPTLRADGSRV